MKHRIYYTAYKDYPKATEFSRNISLLISALSLISIFVILLAFAEGLIYGLLSIFLIIVLFWFIKKYEAKRTAQIIEQEQLEQKERAEYNDLMNRQAQWRDNNELLALGKNSETIKSIAKEKGLTAEQYYSLLQMQNENYVLLHQRYNETHEKKIPFPTK